MSNGWFVPADAAFIMVVVMLPLPQREAGREDGAVLLQEVENRLRLAALFTGFSANREG